MAGGSGKRYPKLSVALDAMEELSVAQGDPTERSDGLSWDEAREQAAATGQSPYNDPLMTADQIAEQERTVAALSGDAVSEEDEHEVIRQYGTTEQKAAYGIGEPVQADDDPGDDGEVAAAQDYPSVEESKLFGESEPGDDTQESRDEWEARTIREALQVSGISSPITSWDELPDYRRDRHRATVAELHRRGLWIAPMDAMGPEQDPSVTPNGSESERSGFTARFRVQAGPVLVNAGERPNIEIAALDLERIRQHIRTAFKFVVQAMRGHHLTCEALDSNLPDSPEYYGEQEAYEAILDFAHAIRVNGALADAFRALDKAGELYVDLCAGLHALGVATGPTTLEEAEKQRDAEETERNAERRNAADVPERTSPGWIPSHPRPGGKGFNA